MTVIDHQALAGRDVVLFEQDPVLRQAHIFSQDDEDAILCALDARRPILLRGEPGVGKTQLAQAAAIALKRAYVSYAVDALTEPRDLRWWEDAVERLAAAQIAGLPQDGMARSDAMAALARENFIRPGPLWWGFNWAEAAKVRGAVEPRQPGDQCDPKNGAVVLIDEIDKADPSVPNGLLEALGGRSFTPPGQQPVTAAVWPLVVITTNEERRLPDAFIRRCIVYDMQAPTGKKFTDWLEARGRLHFQDADRTVLRLVARQTRLDRETAMDLNLRPLPGQAEYLDLLRALFARGDQAPKALEERLRRIGRYVLRKHGDDEAPKRHAALDEPLDPDV